MPALVLFCRRWRAATDDFVFQGIFLSVLFFLSAIFFLIPLCPRLKINACDQASSIFVVSNLGSFFSSCFATFLFLLIAFWSFQGSVLDTPKRWGVPYLHAVGLFCIIVSLIFLSINIYFLWPASRFDSYCPDSSSSTHHLLRAGTLIAIIPWGFYIFFWLLSFDPDGRKTFSLNENNVDEAYLHLWRERCNFICCLCCYKSKDVPFYVTHSDNTISELDDSGNENLDEGPSITSTLEAAASTVARFFHGDDIVPSDVMVGLLLLYERQILLRKQTMRNRPFNAPSLYIKNSSLPQDEIIKEAISSHCPPKILPLTKDNLLWLALFYHFSKFFLAAYGWALYYQMNSCRKMCQLIFDNSMVQEESSLEGSHHSCVNSELNSFSPQKTCCCNRCYELNLKVILKILKLPRSHLLMSSFEDTWGKTGFFVAVDTGHDATSLFDFSSLSYPINTNEPPIPNFCEPYAHVGLSDRDSGGETSNNSNTSLKWHDLFSFPKTAPFEIRSNNTVVVAIRGSMSRSDFITDGFAYPKQVYIGGSGEPVVPESFMHSGILHASEVILRRIGDMTCYYYGIGEKRLLKNSDIKKDQIMPEKGSILERLLIGDLCESPVVVLGHSLGGGCSAIISILLWSRYPQLRGRLRGLCYSLPGGLLSPSLLMYSRSFIAGLYLNCDIVPFMSIHTFDAFRDDILDALANTTEPKASIFWRFLYTSKSPIKSSHNWVCFKNNATSQKIIESTFDPSSHENIKSCKNPGNHESYLHDGNQVPKYTVFENSYANFPADPKFSESSRRNMNYDKFPLSLPMSDVSSPIIKIPKTDESTDYHFHRNPIEDTTANFHGHQLVERNEVHLYPAYRLIHLKKIATQYVYEKVTFPKPDDQISGTSNNQDLKNSLAQVDPTEDRNGLAFQESVVLQDNASSHHLDKPRKKRKRVLYLPVEGNSENVQHVVLSSSMISDHIPVSVFKALKSTWENYKNDLFLRFYD